MFKFKLCPYLSSPFYRIHLIIIILLVELSFLFLGWTNVAKLVLICIKKNFRQALLCFLVPLQHSIDYWLWADLIAPDSERLLKNVVRVHRQVEADLFYIPFFTTISFFLLEPEQWKPLYRVWVNSKVYDKAVHFSVWYFSYNIAKF